MGTLQSEFGYYLTNQKDLVKKFDKEFIVIKNNKVIGHYKDITNAYLETIKSHEIGTFLIQHCTKDSSAYTQNFHSRVSFS